MACTLQPRYTHPLIFRWINHLNMGKPNQRYCTAFVHFMFNVFGAECQLFIFEKKLNIFNIGPLSIEQVLRLPATTNNFPAIAAYKDPNLHFDHSVFIPAQKTFSVTKHLSCQEALLASLRTPKEEKKKVQGLIVKLAKYQIRTETITMKGFYTRPKCFCLSPSKM